VQGSTSQRGLMGECVKNEEKKRMRKKRMEKKIKAMLMKMKMKIKAMLMKKKMKIKAMLMLMLIKMIQTKSKSVPSPPPHYNPYPCQTALPFSDLRTHRKIEAASRGIRPADYQVQC